jgi:hypothetical protein
MSTEIERLPNLIQQAASALASATTAAEVLDVIDLAGVAYVAAKTALRLTAAKRAHDEVVAAARKAMGDALIIEARAKCRLADEYDAAQARGEVQKPGGDHTSSNVLKQNNAPTVEDIGLTRKQVHEARNVRDAEERQPGTVRKIVEEKLQAGEAPTRADVKRAADAILNPPPPTPPSSPPPASAEQSASPSLAKNAVAQDKDRPQSGPITINDKWARMYVSLVEVDTDNHKGVALYISLNATAPYKVLLTMPENGEPEVSLMDDQGIFKFEKGCFENEDGDPEHEVFRDWIMAALWEESD